MSEPLTRRQLINSLAVLLVCVGVLVVFAAIAVVVVQAVTSAPSMGGYIAVASGVCACVAGVSLYRDT